MTPRRLPGACLLLVATCLVACVGDEPRSASTTGPGSESPSSTSAARALERAIAQTTSDRAAYRRTLAARCRAGPSEPSRGRATTFRCELGDDRAPYEVELLPSGSFIARSRRPGPTIMGCCAKADAGAARP